MNGRIWCGVAMLLNATVLVADEAVPPPAPATHAPVVVDARAPVGTSTRAWLALQRDGAQASSAVRPVPGEIAGRTYQRYVQSYERPIPESFEREATGNRGSGSR